MTVLVTGCHDCPFSFYNGIVDYIVCDKLDETPVENYIKSCTVHPSCPLKQQSITVKLEENE